MSFNASYIGTKLTSHTSFFGIKLWILALAIFGLILIIILFSCICIICQRRRRKSYRAEFTLPMSAVSKGTNDGSLVNQNILSCNMSHIENSSSRFQVVPTNIDVDYSSRSSNNISCRVDSFVRRDNRFTLEELQLATNGFSDANVIGCGDYGIVYLGYLLNKRKIAVKKLYRTRGQDEEFVAEVKKLGQVCHKNLVKLLGFCTGENTRILVYEYVDNGNLYHWLHGPQSMTNPLTWHLRMHIIQEIAKGLAYLHHDIEPKIIHKDVKSSNILLDHQWNPKISDIGLPSLDTRTEVMSIDRQSYLCPVSLASGHYNERSDVYGFGVLIVEIVTGRIAFDHGKPQEYIVDWLKSMIINQKVTYLLDQKVPDIPTTKDLKRILLIALKCVDPVKNDRPVMGQVLHMLKPRVSPLAEDILTATQPEMIIKHIEQRQDNADAEPAYYTDNGSV